ncbi:MAG: dethiobiotin synthase [Candidatus Omnitrophota bacterium]
MFTGKVIFVAGTDTGAGKTVATGLLGRYLSRKGYRVVTQKWVQTGCSGFPEDMEVHLRLMEKKRRDFEGYLSLMMPYIFKFPSAPYLSARLEKRRIDLSGIEETLKVLANGFDFVIVEGIGGLLVPLTGSCLLADFVKKLNLPVLLVAGNRLGAINHTLLSLEALKARKIKTLGVIFNNISPNEDKRILQDNPEIVAKISGEKVLGVLPRVKHLSQLHRHFAPIGKKILLTKD